MPDATHDPAYPSIATDINRTGDLPIHELVGGNAWVPQVLEGEYPALGRADEYDATTAWAVGDAREQPPRWRSTRRRRFRPAQTSPSTSG